MADQLHPNHPDYVRPEEGGDRQSGGNNQQVQGPISALSEQTLAVDLARVEIDQQIATAHRFPRNIDVVDRKIRQLALRDEASASRCVYALPRGGKPIVGPSIGFMRIVANAWGNCRIFAEPTYIDRASKMVYARGAFLDLESNVTSAVSVGRRISGKDGRLYNDDMIGVTQMAAVSIAYRNSVRAGVTDGLWYPVYEMALFMVRGTEETLPERREKAIKFLANFGADPAKIFMFLQVKGINEIKVDHLPTLRGMATALQEGSVTADEMFDPRRMAGVNFETVENPLADETGGGSGGGGAGGTSTPVTAKGGGNAQGGTVTIPVGGNAQGGASQEAQGGGGEPGGSEAGDAAEGGQPAAGASAQGSQRKTPARPRGAAAKPAEPKVEPKSEPPRGDAEVGPATEKAAEPAKPAAPAAVLPANPDQYEVYCKGKVAPFESETALLEWWRSKPERDLRVKCMLVEDAFLRCKALVDGRAAELRGGDK